jgi:phosphatidate phosphatase APP1
MPIRRTIHRTALGIDRRLDRRRRIVTGGRLILTPYRGLARRLEVPVLTSGSDIEPASGQSGFEMLLRGRVLRERRITRATEPERVWRNVMNTYRRFHSIELAEARVRASHANAVVDTVTDREGYFQVRLAPDSIDSGHLWHELALELPDHETTAVGHVLLPPHEAEFGIISDIDDTIVLTGATSLLKMARSVLANAASRLPFEGVAELYRALHRDRNPLFYVSSSPWNLYDILHDFMDLNEIPHGPMFLQDWGLDEETFIIASHERHKLEQVQLLVDYYPSLPFVLIGDSGQHDPEIYLQVIQAHPGRIRAAFIRDVTHDLRKRAVAAIIEQSNAAGVEMLYVRDSAEAMEHAQRLGLV